MMRDNARLGAAQTRQGPSPWTSNAKNAALPLHHRNVPLPPFLRSIRLWIDSGSVEGKQPKPPFSLKRMGFQRPPAFGGSRAAPWSSFLKDASH